jgi:tRNA dimethylallyltransferase
MSSSHSVLPLVAIVGPTGSGKSELALAVAERFNGEILNCDSLQVYRYFNIGTAKLGIEERRGIPHHLLDVADPDQPFSAGEYARMARTALAEISGRGRLPIVAGGTGLYLRALINGLFPGPARDDVVRRRLAQRETRRQGSLHRLLRRFDPPAAARIHPHDVQKLVRAVEVCLLTRRSLTAEFAGGRDALEGYRVLKLGLTPPRSELYERLDQRCGRMFEGGLIDEVRRILLLGFSPSVRPLESHGYRQALQFLRKELTLEEALEQARRNTRRYAKRQWTWFRREEAMQWVEGFGNESHVREAVLDRVEQLLGSLRIELTD